MELSTATALLSKGVNTTKPAQVWCDLGAGEGLFTRALSVLLPDTSTIYAIDKDPKSLNKISVESHVKLHKVNADFTLWNDTVPLLDGILMANALHFVEDKNHLVKTLLTKMKPDGVLLLIEYDLQTANAWVPYPIRKDLLKKFAVEAGFTSVSFLHEVPSVYNRSMIYSAILYR
jgi:trans-aconitate methyltransferase